MCKRAQLPVCPRRKRVQPPAAQRETWLLTQPVEMTTAWAVLAVGFEQIYLLKIEPVSLQQ